MDLEEGLLDRVFRVGRIAEVVPGDGLHPIAEAPIEEMTETAVRTAPTVDDAKRITLRKLLDELPEQRRTVFSLFEIEGLSHAEIGDILGITEGNSKWILFATKKELQQKWRTTLQTARI